MTRKKISSPSAKDFAKSDPDETVSINPANLGSFFNDFLAEEGILEEVREEVLKRRASLWRGRRRSSDGRFS